MIKSERAVTGPTDCPSGSSFTPTLSNVCQNRVPSQGQPIARPPGHYCMYETLRCRRVA